MRRRSRARSMILRSSATPDETALTDSNAAPDIAARMMRQRGLATPRRTPEDQRRQLITLERAAQHASRPHDALLAGELVQGARSHPGGEWRGGMLRPGDGAGLRGTRRATEQVRRWIGHRPSLDGGCAEAIAYRGRVSQIIGFAHRGGATSRHLQNTLEAFRLSLAAGADGIESDVALTADGVAVLIHPGVMARLRRPVSRMRRDELPAHVPSVEDVYREFGSRLHVSLDMAAPAAAAQVVDIVRKHGDPSRLWLTYWRLDAIRHWRRRYPDVRLVFPACGCGPVAMAAGSPRCSPPGWMRSTCTTAGARRRARPCPQRGAAAVRLGRTHRQRGGEGTAPWRRRRVLR